MYTAINTTATATIKYHSFNNAVMKTAAIAMGIPAKNINLNIKPIYHNSQEATL